MAKLIGLSGSLRKGSYNTGLLKSAVELVPQGSSLELKTINDIPLFNADLEAEGVPESVSLLKQSIQAADALVIATPEYNGGIPGVLKNAIDWLSRASQGQASVISGLPVALMGAAAGGLGTANAQSAWLPVLRSLHMPLWVDGGSLMVAAAHQKFDENGVLTDASVREQIENYLAGFIRSL